VYTTFLIIATYHWWCQNRVWGLLNCISVTVSQLFFHLQYFYLVLQYCYLSSVLLSHFAEAQYQSGKQSYNVLYVHMYAEIMATTNLVLIDVM